MSKISKEKIEAIKTNVIVFMVTVMVAVPAGMWLNQHLNDQVTAKAANIVKNVKVEATVTPSK